MKDIAVLIIAFNRPHLLEKQIKALKQVNPSRVYVSVDGAREGNADDRAKILKVKELIESLITWTDQVSTLFHQKNLGCGPGPVAGMNWFFSQEEEGIILEDDCIPSVSFFDYCAELLGKYRDNPEVMTISGSRFPVDYGATTDSYHFSIYPHIWGWATWKRSWKRFDFEIKTFDNPETHPKLLRKLSGNKRAAHEWMKCFASVFDGRNRSIWDYQWLYASWLHDGLSVHPAVNLIHNIGFGEDSTHTFSAEESHQMDAEEIDLPLSHPDQVISNESADQYIQEQVFDRKGLFNAVKYKMEQILPCSAVEKLKTFKDSICG